MTEARRAGLIAGGRHALRGFKLIAVPSVRCYVLVPLLINIILLSFALLGIGSALDMMIERYLDGWPEWLQTLLWGIFALLTAVVVFFTFSIVANLVASPFNGMLAEAVERHLNPALGEFAFSWARMLADLRRTLLAELRKLLYIAVRALPLLLISVIPGLNAFAPVLWLLFGAWMLCLEYLDCPLSNHSVFFPRVLEQMRARRRLALGFGGVMTVLTMIPVLNFFAMPIGVAGATSLYCAHIARVE